MKENRAEKLREIYKSAEDFLHEITPKEITKDEMEKYFVVPQTKKTKADILYGLLVSLQNRSMSTNVIGLCNEKRASIFKGILFNCDADTILKNYTADTLLECFKKNFDIKNIESKRNLWVAYAKAVISACEFINKFDSADDFDEFVSRFTYNELSSAALPMLLEREIVGMGFALACDFLKDLGYIGYPKPDKHIKDIICAFDLCANNDYSVYKVVIEMAKTANETPYKVDKVLWLIGSGNFYLHNVKVGHNKDKFIERMKSMQQ